MMSLIFIFFTFVCESYGWGPISHAAMTAMGIGQSNVASCLSATVPSDPCFTMLASTDLPDALAFGKFNLTGDASNGYLCSDLSYLHSPAFGAFMLATALQSNGTLGFDAIGFAQGFLGHTLGDLVGFWTRSGVTRQGILCGNHVGPCSQEIRYLNLWHYMIDLDALWCLELQVDLTTGPSVAALSPAAVQFVADQSVAFSLITPNFPPTTAAAVSSCIQFWDDEQRLVYEMAARKASSQQQRAVLKDDLDFFAPVHGTNNITLFLNAQAKCASKVIAQAVADVQAGQSGAQVMSNAVSGTANLYAAGACNI
jgi:hypothetical protein